MRYFKSRRRFWGIRDSNELAYSLGECNFQLSLFMASGVTVYIGAGEPVALVHLNSFSDKI
jgi:hypothetical protein